MAGARRGVFNFEGGCYAKCIKLSQENEPQIWNAIRFGSVLENVTLDPETHVPDYNDDSRTENTRCRLSGGLHRERGDSGNGRPSEEHDVPHGGCFGVLPPISKLTTDQAMYHFLSGYTAKLAGTEAGVKEPQPNFPLVLARRSCRSAKGLRGNAGPGIKTWSQCWLVNTGWFGGPYGVGSRMKLPYTRAMVNAAIKAAGQSGV